MTHRIHLAWIVVLVVLFSLLHTVPVKPRPRIKRVRTLVLPLKVKGLQLAQARTTGKIVAKTVVSELKGLGLFRLVAGKRVSRKLKSLKKKRVLVKDCHTKKKCIRSVGRRFKAKIIFALHVLKTEDGISISVRALDVRSGKQIREAVELSNGDDEDVMRATRWAVLKASSPMLTSLLKGKGKLEVACAEGDAVLYLNGKSFGKRTNKSFKVGTGVFDIQVKKDGFRPFHDVVVIRPGKRVKVDVVLQTTGPKKVPVIATAPIGQAKKVQKPVADLPAWAVFEKKSDTTPSKSSPVAITTENKSNITPQPKPFLPGEQNPMDVPVSKIDDESDRWYTTWWFWSAIGVVAVGGLTGGLYAAGVFDDTGGSNTTGAAAITWQ